MLLLCTYQWPCHYICQEMTTCHEYDWLKYKQMQYFFLLCDFSNFSLHYSNVCIHSGKFISSTAFYLPYKHTQDLPCCVNQIFFNRKHQFIPHLIWWLWQGFPGSTEHTCLLPSVEASTWFLVLWWWVYWDWILLHKLPRRHTRNNIGPVPYGQLQLTDMEWMSE